MSDCVPDSAAVCGKRKRLTIAQYRSELIELLTARSSRARNFLHEGANTEQILFATIAELQDCKHKALLLEAQLRELKAKQASNPTRPSRSVSPQTISKSSRFDLYPTSADIATPTSTQSSSVPSPSSQSDSGDGCLSDEKGVAEYPLAPSPSIYRDFFLGGDIGQAVIAPNFRIIDCNESFMKGGPRYVFGDISRSQFLSAGVTIFDIEPPALYPRVFQLYEVLQEQGSFHADQVVHCTAPFMALDVTVIGKFDLDPSHPRGRRIRYAILLVRRDWKNPLLSPVEIRRALFGHDHPLPLSARPQLQAVGGS